MLQNLIAKSVILTSTHFTARFQNLLIFHSSLIRFFSRSSFKSNINQKIFLSAVSKFFSLHLLFLLKVEKLEKVEPQKYFRAQQVGVGAARLGYEQPAAMGEVTFNRYLLIRN